MGWRGGENSKWMRFKHSVGEENTQTDMLAGQPAIVAAVNVDLLEVKSAFNDQRKIFMYQSHVSILRGECSVLYSVAE